MPRKKTLASASVERVGLRLSSHEKVCAERMKTLFKSIEELKVEVKSLRNDVSKGKGMISVIVFLGALVASVLGYLKLDG
tara:strand:- start:222 stop:461 length:240 start_codon:yes stop_codon:yes gene_type:complete